MSSHRYDVVVKDGMIFDGTGAPRVRGDLGVSDGRITAMGRVDAAAASEVIDEAGMHVAPGFVDLHTHYDAQIFWDPYCTLSGWHGITSVAIGNCGFGFAPVQPDQREYAMRSMTRVEAIPYDSMRRRKRLGSPVSGVRASCQSTTTPAAPATRHAAAVQWPTPPQARTGGRPKRTAQVTATML